MAIKTGIEWTDATWSPLRARVRNDAAQIAKDKGYASLVQIAETMAGHIGPHCEHVSPGCENCYAETNNRRCLPSNGTGLPYDRRSRDLIEPIVDEKILLQPLKWKTDKRIFCENQSDLFGEWVPDEQIDRVFAVMALCPQHTFQVLTKRAGRMREYWSDYLKRAVAIKTAASRLPNYDALCEAANFMPIPYKHIWLGVSVENNDHRHRIRELVQTPAAVHFISYEPALGDLDLTPWTEEGLECSGCHWLGNESEAVLCEPEDQEDSFYQCPKCGEVCAHCVLNELLGASSGISWIITGGESGPGARPFDIEWARSAVRQCKDAGIACFVKQLGKAPYESLPTDPGHLGPNADFSLELKDRKGGDWDEWPSDLKVRQFPEVPNVSA